MSEYFKYSGVKVNLQDLLEYLDEVLESQQKLVLRSGADATDNELRHNLGVVKGLELAKARILASYGDEPVNAEMHDTRY